MKTKLLLCVVALILSSCERYDEEILPVVGTYDAVVVGLAGPFVMSVSAEYGDDIVIEAPFDGEFWSTVNADIDDKERERKRIKIFRQDIGPDIRIWGEGVYFDFTIQLDYTIRYFGEEYDYTLVGTKF